MDRDRTRIQYTATLPTLKGSVHSAVLTVSVSLLVTGVSGGVQYSIEYVHGTPHPVSAAQYICS